MKFLNYQVSSSAVIVIIVLWVTLLVHWVYSCCEISFAEGFEILRKKEGFNIAILRKKEGFSTIAIADKKKGKEGFTSKGDQPIAIASMGGDKKGGASILRKEGFAAPAPAPSGGNAIAIAGTGKKKEGFVGSGGKGTAAGPEFAASGDSGWYMDPSKWSQPTLAYSSKANASDGAKAIWDRKEQPIPLPPGEMNMFETTPFKPECCPNTFSNSSGCACMTVKQYDYLIHRGGNNVPYSEY